MPCNRWNVVPLTACLVLTVASLVGVSVVAGNRATAAARFASGADVNDYVASKLDDFIATMHVVQHDDNAARKIHPDFGLIYKLKGDIKIRYKEENMMRIDGKVGASNATLIVAGTHQYVKFGPGITRKDDLGASPGKRKTLLDVGMISSGYLAYTNPQSLGSRPVNGVMCGVFRISYKDQTLDTSHRIVWVDPKTRITLKREEYSQTGKLVATFYYRDARQVAQGIWFPSRIEVFNAEGQKAGETSYRDVKVNQGLADSLFKL